MDETLTTIMKLTMQGWAHATAAKLDTLSPRELKMLELNLAELQREVLLAQVRQGT